MSGFKIHVPDFRLEYRGRLLPGGMTPKCFDELESLFAEYERGDFDGLSSDAAMRAFEVVRSNRE